MKSRDSKRSKGKERADAKEAPALPPFLPPSSASRRFPIVGIGASAGGLEALEQFLTNVPEQSGMAYVVVQHLDPRHKDAMVELLLRKCAMPVLQAKDDQRVEPEHVYVIPPNQDLSILHGVLHLLPQSSPRGMNLPIDHFFRALAEDQQEQSVGVVLSGMGSDGTLGLRAIKARAGTTFVQAIASAKFDGMPRSAIEDGLADVIAPVEELPARILAFRRHAPYLSSKAPAALDEKQQSAIEKVYLLLRAQTGTDFSLYKKSTIYRRIERRMGLHQIDKLGHYVRYLRDNPRETELLFRELLIGVTSFFRDPASWDALRDEALPRLLEKQPQGGVLRAWVPGCSTGEEAYSLAIVFKEAVERLKLPRSVQLQVYATDLDAETIKKARQASFPLNIAADVSPERLRRFFIQGDHAYRVGKEIREMVVFAPQNLLAEPPFTKLDVLSCRNLLIYLAPELQRRLIPLFHYCLNPGGILFLGSAETVGTFSSLFGPVGGEARLFRRLETRPGAPSIEFPSSFAPAAEAPGDQGGESLDARKVAPPNLQALVDQLIVQRFSPAVLLTNDKGDILYISSRTGKYLEPPVGKANLNVFAMARAGLRYELSTAFSSALRRGPGVVVRGLEVGTNGGAQTVDLLVERLKEPGALDGTMIIVLKDAPAPARQPAPAGKSRRAPARLAEIEGELRRAREQVQTAREEMQASQEELKASNEELQSTNEELQSTNEELTTSKEEMQSMNEELQTVNQELQSKVDELSRSNNDMKNLLNSTNIATLFLDDHLHVRRFTTPAAKLIKLIPGDAGRPITDIASDLDYPDLAADAHEVLRTLVSKSRDVHSRSGEWFTVRIMPYRTLKNVIDGVVLTFVNSTASKSLETSLREQASQLRQMADSLPNLVMGCRPDGACDYLSRRWVEYTGSSEAEQLGYGWLERVDPRDRERVRSEWRTAVRKRAPLDTEFRIRGKGRISRWFKTRSVPILDEQGAVVKWYGTCTDIDDVKRAAETRGAEEARESSKKSRHGSSGHDRPGSRRS